MWTMKRFEDVYGRGIRLTSERQLHIENDHPEMGSQIDKIKETLSQPERIIRSKTDPEVELFYRHYDETPITEKYLCVVVKTPINDRFIITAYFTDTIKRGEMLWQKE
jgi:hypothetical protein